MRVSSCTSLPQDATSCRSTGIRSPAPNSTAPACVGVAHVRTSATEDSVSPPASEVPAAHAMDQACVGAHIPAPAISEVAARLLHPLPPPRAPLLHPWLLPRAPLLHPQLPPRILFPRAAAENPVSPSAGVSPAPPSSEGPAPLLHATAQACTGAHAPALDALLPLAAEGPASPVSSVLKPPEFSSVLKPPGFPSAPKPPGFPSTFFPGH
ncbi:splicing factor 3A subunit 2-like [Fundulus heteroclitus]|uniref:splicing factor 3A subunit 2-like n=1 Tax=Fundulus heteroclitus TaxID=8078 RepID=UPI00165A9943|nr:splicing factor 3A subunit 2-like [Fundulus heteroclitus]